MGYAYQATVTVPAPTGGPHANFTFLLKGSNALLKLASLGTGGAIQNSTTRPYTGYTQTVPADLVLSTDAAITSLMTWGIDNWDSVNGVVWIWVKIPSYSAGFTIYVSIGNSLVTNYQGGAIGSEFDASTQAAYHFPDGSSLAVADFVNAFAGTNHSATPGTGQIDGCMVANGTSQYVSNSGITLASAWSFQAWINPANLSANRSIVGGPNSSWGFRLAATTGKLYGTKTQVADDTQSTGTVSAGAWSHVFFTQDALGNYIYYINGAAASVTLTSGKVGTAATTDIARGIAGGEWFPGSIDEVRFISAVRPANWIATEYANQNNPPAMGSFSPISSGGSTSLTLVGCQ